MAAVRGPALAPPCWEWTPLCLAAWTNPRAPGHRMALSPGLLNEPGIQEAKPAWGSSADMVSPKQTLRQGLGWVVYLGGNPRKCGMRMGKMSLEGEKPQKVYLHTGSRGQLWPPPTGVWETLQDAPPNCPTPCQAGRLASQATLLSSFGGELLLACNFLPL